MLLCKKHSMFVKAKETEKGEAAVYNKHSQLFHYPVESITRKESEWIFLPKIFPSPISPVLASSIILSITASTYGNMISAGNNIHSRLLTPKSPISVILVFIWVFASIDIFLFPRDTWSLLTTISILTLARNLSSENSEPAQSMKEILIGNGRQEQRIYCLTKLEAIKKWSVWKENKLMSHAEEHRSPQVTPLEPNCLQHKIYLPPCLSVEPPWEPKPRTSETVTLRIPILSRALKTQIKRPPIRTADRE